MRMRKREVTDRDEIFGILARCRVAHVGMFGDGHPYVVPVSFGMEVVEDKARVYFHCGKRGMKVDLLKRNPNACVEAELFHAYELLERGIDTRYESAIGFGRCHVVEDDAEILEELRLICEHCGFADVPLDTCLGLAAVEAHCAAIPTERVACYCTTCDAALESGGKDAINLIELVSGKFRA